MKKLLLPKFILLLALFTSLITGVAIAQPNVTIDADGNQVYEFEFTGAAQTWSPGGPAILKVEVWGAQGENNSLGGLGGYATGELTISETDELYIFTGEQPTSRNGGWNGGGDGGTGRNNTGGGGGASDVRLNGTSLGDRIIVGGGGGGRSSDGIGDGSSGHRNGGDGGGLTGEKGEGGDGGDPGTQAGGFAIGQGGSGKNATNTSDHGANGGGGGGYYGGFGGQKTTSTTSGHGGGGGSSYIDGVDDGETETGVREGHGLVRITVILEGDGTEDHPYLISTPYQLNLVRDFLGSNFKMTADIDLNVAPYNSGEGWEPIGSEAEPFAGTFDGDGHEISNLFINRTTAKVGFFGESNASAVITDLFLTDVSVTSNQDRVGALGGRLFGILSNIYVSGEINGNGRVGGVVGSNHATSESIAADITVITTTQRGGGFAGSNNASIKDSYIKGSVTKTGGGDARVGGLVGNNFAGTVENNYVAVELNGSGSFSGGLIGDRAGGTITGNLVDMDVSNTGSAGRGISSTTEEMTKLQTYLDRDWDFDTVWGFNHQENGSYPFLRFQENYTHDLRNDVTLVDLSINEGQLDFDSGTTTYEVLVSNGTSVAITFETQTHNTADKASPQSVTVGNSDEEFTVTVTAEDQVTTQSYILTFKPFFAGGDGSELNPYQVASVDQLDRVRLELDKNFILTADLDLGGDDNQGDFWNDGNGWQPIGSEAQPFAGTFNGNGHIIDNLFIDRANDDRVGFIGSLTGAITKLGIINTDIEGNARVGILTGQNYGTLSETFTTGTVKGNSAYIGGLVGFLNNGGSVTQSYSMADVSGPGSTGGLVGAAWNSSGTITKSWSSGKIDDQGSGGGTVGGIVGRNEAGGGASNLYWDVKSSGKTNSAFGTGLSTMEMRTQSKFVGFDFDTIWKMPENELERSYPNLRNVIQDPTPGLITFAGGDGSEGNPLVINTLDQLDAIRLFLDKNFILTSDIDLDGDDVQGDFWNDGKGWEPIGDNDEPFIGTIDGNGKTISNLFIDRDDEQFVGLIGVIGEDAKVHDLKITDADITGNDRTGVLAGINSGEIWNVSVLGSVNGGSRSGGIVGKNDSPGLIYQTFSDVHVTGNGDRAGGHVGSNYGELRDSYTNGNVDQESTNQLRRTGGAVGYIGTNGQVLRIYATGRVAEGVSYTSNGGYGGLIGRNSGGTVTDSFFDEETTEQTRSEGGTGLSSEDMKKYEIFFNADWDFDSVWGFNHQENDSYPFLRIQENFTHSLRDDATLANITVNQGTLDFDANTTEYTVIVSDDIDEVVVSFTSKAHNVTDIESPQEVELTNGVGNVTITVTAEDQVTTKEYTISFVPESPNNVLYTSIDQDRPLDMLFVENNGQIIQANRSDIDGITLEQIKESLIIPEGATVTAPDGIQNGAEIKVEAANGDIRTYVFYGIAPKIFYTFDSGRIGMALDESGHVYTYGLGSLGGLGHGNEDNQTRPKRVTTSGFDELEIIDITSGRYYALFLDSEGRVYASGDEDVEDGRRGLGENVPKQNTPVQLEGDIVDRKIIAITAGNRHSLLLDTEGRVYSFGFGHQGRLGHGNTDNQFTPKEITTGDIVGRHITTISAGHAQSFLTDNQGRVYSFGMSNRNGRGGQADIPLEITGNIIEDEYIVAVSSGVHALMTDLQGNVYSFGGNDHGQLGRGTTSYNESDPAKINHPSIAESFITSISASDHSLLSDSNGKVFSFGRNTVHQLGHGHDNAVTTPQQITINDFDQNYIQRVNGGFLTTGLTDREGRFFAIGNNGHTHGLGMNNRVETPSQINFQLESELLAPENEATDLSTTPQFTWSQFPLDVSYSIQISTQESFEDAALWHINTSGIEDNNFQIDENNRLEVSTKYYWRVAIRDSYATLGYNEPFSFTTGYEIENGAGTEADPYIVSGPEDLQFMAKELDAHYKLTDDIDLDIAPWNTGEGWEPIGSEGNPFTGTFDGAGHTITGLMINRPDTDNVGFFGVIGQDATVQNIFIEDANVSGDNNVGVITGLNNGSITNAFASGQVSGDSHVGGLVGINKGNITDSYSLAEVIAQNAPSGGLVALNDEGTISNSYAAGSVAGENAEIGGLVGINNNGTIETSLWDIGASGQDESAGGEGKTTVEMQTYKTYVDAGWDVDDTWGFNHQENDGYPFLRIQDNFTHSLRDDATLASLSVSEGDLEFDAEVLTYQVKVLNTLASVDVTFATQASNNADKTSPAEVTLTDGTGQLIIEVTAENQNTKQTYTINFEPAFGSGSGTKEDPFVIASADQIEFIHENLDANFELESDINLDVAPWNTGEGWNPIGTIEEPFTGTIDGNGNVITGLFIDRPGEDNVGFFGVIGEDAEIENLAIEDATVTGGSNVGLIGGSNNGTVTNSYGTGEVNGDSHVGGLIGVNAGEIANSYSLADVNTEQAPAGGLVAVNNADGTITLSYSAGSVAGDDPEIGGLIGINNEGDVTASLWDVDASGQVESDGGEGKSTLEIQTISTFDEFNWDFDEIWGLNPDENQGYPFLRIQELNHQPASESAVLASLGISVGNINFDAETFNYADIVIPSGTESVEVTFTVAENGSLDITSPSQVTIEDGTGELSITVTAQNQIATREYSLNFIESSSRVVLSSPENNAENVALRPEFSWNEAELADTYTINIATDQEFQNVVVSESGIEATTFTHDADFDEDTEFFWRVRGVNATGNAEWSATYSFTTLPEISGVVTLTSPADSTKNVSLLPTLEWNAAQGADSYEVVLSDNRDLNNPVFTLSDIENTEFEIADSLKTSTRYFWAVRSQNPAGFSAWSDTLSFVTLPDFPGLVVLSSPENESENVALRPDFNWNEANLAESYTITIATDGAFENVVESESGITTTSFTAETDFEEDTEYFWRVRSQNPAGLSAWSDVLSFMTIPDLPAQVVLNSPENNAENVALRPEFSWNEADLADSYTISIATDNEFENVIVSEIGIEATSFTVEKDLNEDSEFFWRVRAQNPAGFSNWSETFSFVTVPAVPVLIAITAPEDGAVDVTLEPTFEWIINEAAEFYELLISSSNSFADTLIIQDSIATNSFTLESELNRNEVYYWILRGKNAGGAGVWTDTLRFTTIPEVPAQVVLSSLENESTNAQLQPTLRWESADRAESYDVIVSLKADLSEPLINESGLTTTSFEISEDLDRNATYYWQVRGVNIGGVGDWSSSWSFTTIPEVPAQVVLGAPANEAGQVALDTDFSWDSAARAETYEIQVSTTSDFDDPMVSESGLESIGFEPEETEFAHHTVYFWRVRASNAGGDGDWSDVFEFRTLMELPGQVSLASPEDSLGGVAINPVFSWEQATNAAEYQLQVSVNDDFEELLADISQTETTNSSIDSLNYYASYVWRVRASNESGNGEWSDVQQFMTEAMQPVIEFPANGISGVSTAPRIRWNSEYAESSYRLQISLSDQPNEVLMDTLIEKQYMELEGLNSDTSYSWLVRIEDPTTYSAWTDTVSFTTRPAPDAPGAEEPIVEIEYGGTSEQGVATESDYRMISFPGAVSIPLSSVFSGEQGEDWTAWIDDGSENNFYVEYSADNDAFEFAPGRGFWVLSKNVVNLQRQLKSVGLNVKDSYSIPLHEGWNIIGNPFNFPVSWEEIQVLNNLGGNLLSFANSYQETEVMEPFEGYYFYNDPNNSIDHLEIPYSDLDSRGRDNSTLVSMQELASSRVVINTDFRRRGGLSAHQAVTLVFPDNNDFPMHAYAGHVPASGFGEVGMVMSMENSTRTAMNRKADYYNETGEVYELDFKAPVGTKITWSANFTEMGDQARVLLIHPITNQNHLLGSGDEIEILASEPEVTYEVYVGDEAYLREIQESLLPDEISLLPNYPNPFNPVTTIRFALPQETPVRLEVYDLLGRRVQTLHNGQLNAGWHIVQFDGSQLASGVYFYRLQADNTLLTGKMMLIK